MSRDLLSAPRVRCLLVWLAATGVALALVAALAPELGTPGPERFDDALVLLCEAALLVCVCWAWLVTTVVTLDALRGRRRARPGVPAGVRRVVLAACGAALVGGLVQPAHGDSAQRERHAPSTLVHGIPLPDRATAVGRVSRLFARQQQSRPAPSVLVRPGDSLWGVAEQRLGAGHAWPRVYRVNRAVVGPDPDLIRPGQRLALPEREEEE